MTLHDLEQVAAGVGRAMAEKGYPGFTLEAYVPRPTDSKKPTHEVLTRGGIIRFTFYG
jgi:hypothetical protein